MDDALAELKAVLELSDDDPEAHRIYGAISLLRRNFDEAKFHIEKALAVNPNDAHIAAKSANFYSHYGDPEKALALLEHAVTINPHHPDWYWQEFGLAAWANEDFPAASQHLIKSSARTDFDYAYLAASHAAMGNSKEANNCVQLFRGISSNMTARIYSDRQPFRLSEVRQRLEDQLLAAGLR